MFFTHLSTSASTTAHNPEKSKYTTLQTTARSSHTFSHLNMRLINTKTRQMEEFIGKNIPKYAILSHTWEEEEVTFSGMMTNPDHWKKKGYEKIDMTCKLAASDGLDYAWVDTCCIDKSSSAELSEAINSMFRWYQRSAVCYGYLSDLQPSTEIEVGLKECRWITPGWTLQELIAPNDFRFYDKEWNYRNSKRGLIRILSRITGINTEILEQKAGLSSVPVGRRMAWAAGRETTRIEDRAYSLLGIFGVNMPMLYGEEEKAFRRLQEEIIKQTADFSIFAWKLPASSRPVSCDPEDMVCGILAQSPDFFQECLSLRASSSTSRRQELSILNGRVKTDAILPLKNWSPETGPAIRYLDLECSLRSGQMRGVKLMTLGPSDFVRCNPWDFGGFHEVVYLGDSSAQNYILTNVQAASGYPDVLYTNMRPFLMERRSDFFRVKESPGFTVSFCLPDGRFDHRHRIVCAPNNPYQDFTILGMTLSIDSSELPAPGNQKIMHFNYLLLVTNWNRASFTDDDEHNAKVLVDTQFLILHPRQLSDIERDNLNTFVKGTGDTYDVILWLSRHDFLRVSSVVHSLSDDPSNRYGLEVSVKPAVESDPELSRRRFLAFTFSWKIGDLALLWRYAPERTPWDLIR